MIACERCVAGFHERLGEFEPVEDNCTNSQLAAETAPPVFLEVVPKSVKDVAILHQSVQVIKENIVANKSIPTSDVKGAAPEPQHEVCWGWVVGSDEYTMVARKRGRGHLNYNIGIQFTRMESFVEHGFQLSFIVENETQSSVSRPAAELELVEDHQESLFSVSADAEVAHTCFYR